MNLKVARHFSLVVCLLTSLLCCTVTAEATSLTPVQPGVNDKCPVCGMFVAKYPDWLAEVRYESERTVFFDGAKDLFKYLFNHQTYEPKGSANEFAGIFVTDYYAIEPIDARKAFFVVGSDVYGPMGRELIPFKSREDASEFLRDHHGERIVLFKNVSSALTNSLD